MTLKILKTKKDYEKALERLDVIFDSIPGTTGGDELEVLGFLIDKYEQEHFPIGFPDRIEAIKFRMEQMEYNPADLMLKKISESKTPSSDDWRRQGQEKYLNRVQLQFKQYRSYRLGWDHDHCEFCNARFSLFNDDLKRGYSSKGGYRWICENCFNDFKDEFNWRVKSIEK